MKLHPTLRAAYSLPPLRILALIVLLVLAAALAGCASLTQAGNTTYTIKAVPAADGKTVCYEFQSADGKEFKSRAIQLQATCGVGAALTITEGESKAFRGQGIAAKAATVLPVTGLSDLLGDGK